MDRCEQYWDLISASLDGGLTAEEQARLDAHLAQCPDCRALWEQLNGLEAELMELEAPGPDFTDRVMAAVGTTQQDIPFTDLPQNRKPGKEAQKQLNAWWKPVRNLVLVAACCLIVLGLGQFASQFFRAGSSAPAAGNSMAAQDSAAAGSQESTAAAPEESGAATGSNGAGAEVQEDTAGTTAGSAADGSLSTAEGVPALELSGGSYVLTGETSPTLPQGFQPAGTLTADQAGEAGYAGCGYYTNPEAPGVCYVAQGDGSYLRWELAGE